MLQQVGDQLIAVLPPDLEQQVTEIIEGRGLGIGDSAPIEPVDEGTDALEDGSVLPEPAA